MVAVGELFVGNDRSPASLGGSDELKGIDLRTLGGLGKMGEGGGGWSSRRPPTVALNSSGDWKL